MREIPAVPIAKQLNNCDIISKSFQEYKQSHALEQHGIDLPTGDWRPSEECFTISPSGGLHADQKYI